MLIASLIAASAFQRGDKAFTRRDFGLDFVAFYRAGTLVRDGNYRQLYDLKSTADFDRELVARENLSLGNTIGLFYNPPFFALAFWPLAGLGYFQALFAWSAFGMVCYLAAVCLVARMIGSGDWRNWGLGPAVMCVSMPFVLTVFHAQNTFLSLLLMAIVVTAWRSGRAFWAGLAAGVLFYKPQLAAVIVAALVVTQGWRALAGATLSAGSLTAIGEILLPGSFRDFLRNLTPNFHAMLAAHPYLWARHVTFRGFWQVVLGQFAPAHAASLAVVLAIACSIPVALLLCACVLRSRGAQSMDRVIAAVIAASPLIMPYYVDYDLLLLAIPAVLFAAEMLCSDGEWARRDVWLVRAWIGLFFLLLINAPLTGILHVNLVVPAICAIAMMHISRAFEVGAVEAEAREDSVFVLPRSAAA